ncbi:uncharacterized protein LOC126457548 [Schistocerca serialis cubense]|uniref:uncharacterized protein LOC126457548 n=1 Tax=Schistocerca serialis cubense TaxID=2023355 RepID=UPI00214F23EA|nr:uncharacterized protein LOC126457548 [Schistocerca serialis cubense]
MASKLLIFLAFGLAVQSTAAAPAPGISDWFTEVGNFFENIFNVQKNLTQHAAENAEKIWQDIVESAEQDAKEVGSWIQNAYNETTAAWNSIQEKLQASAQKAIVSAQQAIVSAGQQISQEAAEWVQEASTNLQNAVNAISTKTHENFEEAMEFVQRGEAALEQLQKAQTDATSQVIQGITNSIQQSLQNVQSLLDKASAEVNKNSN